MAITKRGNTIRVPVGTESDDDAVPFDTKGAVISAVKIQARTAVGRLIILDAATTAQAADVTREVFDFGDVAIGVTDGMPGLEIRFKQGIWVKFTGGAASKAFIYLKRA